MVVFDTTTIILALDPDAEPPKDLQGKVVSRCKERIENLLLTLNKAKTPILIPTPVLAEYMVGAGPNKSEFLERIFASSNSEFGSFDVRAAVELSELPDPDLQGRKKLDPTVTKAKI